jgi:hypothetical protein
MHFPQFIHQMRGKYKNEIMTSNQQSPPLEKFSLLSPPTATES